MPITSLAYAYDATLDLIVMCSVFHCYQPHTFDVQFALLIFTVVNPVVDADPFDADVVVPIDDTNNQRIPHKNIKT